MTSSGLSDDTLACVLAVLPAAAPGVAPVDVHSAVGMWSRRTIYAALAALVLTGRVAFAGEMGQRRYWRVAR